MPNSEEEPPRLLPSLQWHWLFFSYDFPCFPRVVINSLTEQVSGSTGIFQCVLTGVPLAGHRTGRVRFAPRSGVEFR